MRICFVLAGVIFVLCQLIVSGTRTPAEQAVAADRLDQTTGWSATPADTDGMQAD